jgi:hypothetical protein
MVVSWGWARKYIADISQPQMGDVKNFTPERRGCANPTTVSSNIEAPFNFLLRNCV